MPEDPQKVGGSNQARANDYNAYSQQAHKAGKSQNTLTSSPASANLNGQLRPNNDAFSFSRYYNTSARLRNQQMQPSEHKLDLTPSKDSSAGRAFFQVNQDAINAMTSSGGGKVPYPQEALTNAETMRDLQPQLPKNEVRKLGLADTSPYARMNKAVFKPNFQRDYFLGHAEQNGYRLAAEEDATPENAELNGRATGYFKDKVLYDDWSRLDGEKISEKDFYEPRLNQTKEERIAFALNLARVYTREKSDEGGGKATQSIDSLAVEYSNLSRAVTAANTPTVMSPRSVVSPSLTSVREATPDIIRSDDEENVDESASDSEKFKYDFIFSQFTPAHGKEKSPGAETIVSTQSKARNLDARLAGTKALYEGQMSVLSDDSIDAGIELLAKLLEPPPGNVTAQDQSARQRWTPCKEWSEVNEIVRLFKNTCISYNDLAEARNEALQNQNLQMNDTYLPRLGMPLELRSGVMADEERTKAAAKFAEENGWGENNSWGSRLKQFGHFSLSVLGTGLTLGFSYFLSPTWRHYVKSHCSTSYRMKQTERHADLAQTQALKSENRKLAKEWVLKQHMTQSASLDTQPVQTAYDPTGLLTAFAHNSDRAQLVKNVVKQLELAAQGDILAAKEQLAKDRGVTVKGENVEVPNEDYLLDPVFLREIAEGIVDGLSEGLDEIRLQEKQLRQVSLRRPQLANIDSGVPLPENE